MNKMRTATKAKHEIPGARTDREPGRENPGGAPSAVRARIGFDVAEITSCCRSEQRTPVGLSNHPANHTWRNYAITQQDLRTVGSEDRAVHLGAANASEMAPCPGRTRGSWNHTVSQPQRGPSACPESGRAATLRTPRFRCEGRLPSVARNEVRLRSESLRLGAAADTGSTPVASKVRPTKAGGVGELAVSGTALGVRGEPEHRPRTRSTTLNERS